MSDIKIADGFAEFVVNGIDLIVKLKTKSKVVIGQYAFTNCNTSFMIESLKWEKVTISGLELEALGFIEM